MISDPLIVLDPDFNRALSEFAPKQRLLLELNIIKFVAKDRLRVGSLHRATTGGHRIYARLSRLQPILKGLCQDLSSPLMSADSDGRCVPFCAVGSCRIIFILVTSSSRNL